MAGGGARGAAHLGVLQALEEHGIYPSILSGTSSGSLASLMYAHGFSPQEILRIIKETRFFRQMALQPGLGKKGLVNIRFLKRILSKYVTKTRFEELDKELHVCITNMRLGHAEYISEGDVIVPVLASCAVPGLFTPVMYNNDVYSDGGVLNNFPIEPLEGKCDFIIGSGLSPLNTEPSALKSMRSVLERTYLLTSRAASTPRKERSDWFIEPFDLHKYGIMDLRKLEEIYKIGYEAACIKLEAEHPMEMLAAKASV